MPKKAKTAHKQSQVGTSENSTPNNDTLYRCIDVDGKPVYLGGGTSLLEAIRLARTLVAPSGVARVEEDGTLTMGRLDGGTFSPAEVAQMLPKASLADDL
jgi:hypothetical protein